MQTLLSLMLMPPAVVAGGVVGWLLGGVVVRRRAKVLTTTSDDLAARMVSFADAIEATYPVLRWWGNAIREFSKQVKVTMAQRDRAWALLRDNEMDSRCGRLLWGTEQVPGDGCSDETPCPEHRRRALLAEAGAA